MTFDKPISNGDGWDFAVFENSFSDGFLELAYVEVSADGTNFFRFYNRSLTSQPVAAFGTIDPTDINGLAGKYRQGYGTPFDLTDVGLSSATHVRIVDIIGNGAYFDSESHVVYDPYPISGSAGFDLDAVGVIHQGASPVEAPSVTTSSAAGISTNSARLYGTVNPNGSSTTYYFQYGLTTAYGLTTGSQNAGNGSTAVSVIADLSGLTPTTHTISGLWRKIPLGYPTDSTETLPRINRRPPMSSMSFHWEILAIAAVITPVNHPLGTPLITP